MEILINISESPAPSTPYPYPDIRIPPLKFQIDVSSKRISHPIRDVWYVTGTSIYTDILITVH